MVPKPRPESGACTRCEARAVFWQKLQERLLSEGEELFHRYLTSSTKEILWSQHAEGRLFYRCLSKKKVLAALEDRVVIENRKEVLLIFTSIKSGREYRPVHVVLALDRPGQATVVTVCDPRSEAWRWDRTLTRRVCWCDREEELLWA